MLIDYKGITINPQDGYTNVMSHAPQECTTCHRMTCFFINRNGQTACTDCQRGKES